MKITILVENKYHLKQQLLARDLIKEVRSNDLCPLLSKRINFITESKFVLQNYSFILDKDYYVEISQYIDEDYFCIHLSNIDQPITEDELCINKRHKKFLFMTEKLKSEALGLPTKSHYDRGLF